MLNTQDIRSLFIEKYKNQDFITDKSGSKVVELISPCFQMTENSIFGKVNETYVAKELDWYLSKSLSVWDIEAPVPKIWQEVCSRFGFINSNYGWCIFSEENGHQYQNVLHELMTSKDSRRALMIYTRPSMWNDYNRDGMSDFMCTNTVHCMIRNNKLIYIVNQRSCDVVFGMNNDNSWHKYVYNLLFAQLKEKYETLEKEPVTFQIGSLHIYERHFKFIEEKMK